jgi:hypothetical protein
MKPHTSDRPGSDHSWVEAQLAARIALRQRLIDELKLQVHLGTRQVRDRVAPLLKKVELDLRHAKAELRQLDESDDGDWPRIQQALEHTLHELEESLEQALRSSERSED